LSASPARRASVRCHSSLPPATRCASCSASYTATKSPLASSRRSSGHGHSVTKPSSSSMRIVVSLIAASRRSPGEKHTGGVNEPVHAEERSGRVRGRQLHAIPRLRHLGQRFTQPFVLGLQVV